MIEQPAANASVALQARRARFDRSALCQHRRPADDDPWLTDGATLNKGEAPCGDGLVGVERSLIVVGTGEGRTRAMARA
jgi:hypothetical protein